VRPARPRDPVLDNAKGLLIILVVIGHMLNQATAGLAVVIHTFLYSFHMPAFVMISGYFSRRWQLDKQHVRSMLTDVIVPYLIFTEIDNLAIAVRHGQFRLKLADLSLLEPTGPTWFLLALVVWRISAPLLRSLKPWIAVVGSVALCVIAPLDPRLSPVVSAGRIIGMLPYFVVGLLLTPKVIATLRRWWARFAGCAFLIGLFIWFKLGHGYGMDFGMTGAYMKAIGRELMLEQRLPQLVIGLVASFAIIAVVPKVSSWLTTVGQNSLEVLVVHILPLQVLWGIPAAAAVLGGTLSKRVMLALIVLGVLWAVFLGSWPVACVLQLITRPKWLGRLLWRREPGSLVPSVDFERPFPWEKATGEAGVTLTGSAGISAAICCPERGCPCVLRQPAEGEPRDGATSKI
jgi:fucose 4-O-acetylase-like acetyltransferase